jgi:hypothetical protein
MTQLLLSFCYAKPSGYVLARFDTRTNVFQWVDLRDVAGPVVGATGLCRLGEHYYAALQIRVPGTVGTLLAEIDRTGRVRRAARLAEVFDAHSLVPWHGELLIVSSGSNQVFAVDWQHDAAPRVRVFFEREPGADTLHMNSLQTFNGRVYLSLFGCKPGASWREARDGQILDLSAGGEVVRRGLRHPHSLFVDRATLLCLSSRDGSLVHVAGAPRGADRPLDGYVRGALAAGGNLFVGTSMPRTHSKSRGVSEAAHVATRSPPSAAEPRQDERSAHAGHAGGGCGLHIVDAATGVSDWLDLSPFGAELYDIAEWSGEGVCGERIDAMAERLRAVNAEFGELIGAVYRMRNQHGAVARMLREMMDAGCDMSSARGVLESLANDLPALPEWSYLHARMLLDGNSNGRSASDSRNAPAALPYLIAALDGGYDSFDVLHHLARLYDAAHDHSVADTHARRALSLAPPDASPHVIDELRRIVRPAQG